MAGILILCGILVIQLLYFWLYQREVSKDRHRKERQYHPVLTKKSTEKAAVNEP